jgi:hypothetical protein
VNPKLLTTVKDTSADFPTVIKKTSIEREDIKPIVLEKPILRTRIRPTLLLIAKAARVRGIDLKSWGKETIKRRNPIMAAQRVVVCQGRINVWYTYLFIYFNPVLCALAGFRSE